MGAAQPAKGSEKLVLATGLKNISNKHPLAASQPPSTPTKTSGTYLPEAQSQRILQRYVAGASIREISRVEKRDRATITKIVKSEQMESYVQNMKERFVGLGCAAMDALEHGLIVEKDSRLAYQLLRDIGVIQGVQETQLAAMQPVAAEQDKNAGVKKVMAGLASIVFERAKVYGTPLGQQLEEDLEKAGGQFDRRTGLLTVIDEH